MCNFFFGLYLTSRMFDGEFFFFKQIKNEDIWYETALIPHQSWFQKDTHSYTHIWKEFNSIALTCSCIESALASFFKVSIQLQVLMSEINFILHDFDNSTCVQEIKWMISCFNC